MSNVSSPDEKKTTEEVQDDVGGMLSSPLSYDDANALAELLYGSVFTTSDGALDVATDGITSTHLDGTYPDGSVAAADLGFDPATQTELNSHSGDTSNPHNVTDDQTGAATALSSHAGDAGAHHAPYSPTVLSSGTVSVGTDVVKPAWHDAFGTAEVKVAHGGTTTTLVSPISQKSIINAYAHSQDLDWEVLSL